MTDDKSHPQPAGMTSLDAAFMRDVLAASDDCIKLMDLDGSLTFMSVGGMRVMEIDDFDTIRGCPWPNFWQGKGNDAAHEAIAAARAGETRQFIGAADTAKGNPRWWDVRVSPIFGDDGKPARILSISRDITGTRKAEETALHAQQRMKDTLQAGSLGYWDLDLQTLVLEASDICKANFGRTAEQPLTYDDLRNAVHPEDRARLQAAVEATLNDGADYDIQYRVLRPDGDTSWVLIRGQLVRDGTGNPVSMSGISLDISDLKAVEEKLARSEERLSLALGASGMVGIWDWDLQAGLIYADRNFAEIYTVDPTHAAQGAPLEDFTRNFHPDDAPAFELELKRVFDGQSTFEHEYRILQPDGDVRWVHARGRLIKDDAGTPIRFSGASVEITERRRAEERQNLLMHELAHRVKNTLAIVQAITSQSLRNATSVQEAGEKLQARIAALSKAHDVLMQENRLQAPIGDVVESTVTNMGMQGSDRIRIIGDKVLLGPQAALSVSLVLHELMTNALKYGSLSNDTGIVEIEWTVIPSAEERALHFSWREVGGPAVSPPQNKGFGSRLIRSSLAAFGETRMEYPVTGLVLEMVAPLSKIEAGPESL